MQRMRPTDEIRIVIYGGYNRQKNIIDVENVLRETYPGRTRSSGIFETREGDGLHLIVTIKMKEAQP